MRRRVFRALLRRGRRRASPSHQRPRGLPARSAERLGSRRREWQPRGNVRRPGLEHLPHRGRRRVPRMLQRGLRRRTFASGVRFFRPRCFPELFPADIPPGTGSPPRRRVLPSSALSRIEARFAGRRLSRRAEPFARGDSWICEWKTAMPPGGRSRVIATPERPLRRPRVVPARPGCLCSSRARGFARPLRRDGDRRERIGGPCGG